MLAQRPLGALGCNSRRDLATELELWWAIWHPRSFLKAAFYDLPTLSLKHLPLTSFSLASIGSSHKLTPLINPYLSLYHFPHIQNGKIPSSQRPPSKYITPTIPFQSPSQHIGQMFVGVGPAFSRCLDKMFLSFLVVGTLYQEFAFKTSLLK